MAITGLWPTLPSKWRKGRTSAPPRVTAEVRVPLPPRVTARTATLALSGATVTDFGNTMAAEVMGRCHFFR